MRHSGNWGSGHPRAAANVLGGRRCGTPVALRTVTNTNASATTAQLLNVGLVGTRLFINFNLVFKLGRILTVVLTLCHAPRLVPYVAVAPFRH